MELTGDKDKLRRAYLRARRLKLSSALEELLGFKPKNTPPTPSLDIARLESDLEDLQDLSTTRRLTHDELERLCSFANDLKTNSLLENARMIQCVRTCIDKEESLDSIPRFQRPIIQDDKVLGKCLFDLALSEKKLISSYIRIAPWIHYTSNKNSKEFRALKKKEWLLDPCMRRIFSAYKKLSIKFPPETLIQRSLFNSKLIAEIPLFFSSVPHNNWGKIFANFSQLLGFNHIDYILQIIRAKSSENDHPFHIWLDRADKETKLNWHQIQSASIGFSNEELKTLLIRFMSRYTSLVCRDGILSLHSLSQEGSPPDLLRDLESWIIRDS